MINETFRPHMNKLSLIIGLCEAETSSLSCAELSECGLQSFHRPLHCYSCPVFMEATIIIQLPNFKSLCYPFCYTCKCLVPSDIMFISREVVSSFFLCLSFPCFGSIYVLICLLYLQLLTFSLQAIIVIVQEVEKKQNSDVTYFF